MDGDILNIGAGLAIGLGAIGPGIGIGSVSYTHLTLPTKA